VIVDKKVTDLTCRILNDTTQQLEAIFRVRVEACTGTGTSQSIGNAMKAKSVHSGESDTGKYSLAVSLAFT
jgi:hypothetical protein